MRVISTKYGKIWGIPIIPQKYGRRAKNKPICGSDDSPVS